MNRVKESLNNYVCNKDILKRKIASKIKQKNKLGIYVTIFASFILAIIISGSIYYNTEASYVSIDINPSIVLSANVMDKVIKVEGLNSEAKTILSELNLNNMDISKAVNLVVDKATKKGFLDINSEDNAMLITTYCDNEVKRQKLQTRIHDDLNNELENKGIRSLIIDQQLTSADIKKANEYNVSPGKILFVKKALLEHPELKFEDLIHLPAKEIAKYISGYDETMNNDCGKGKAYGCKKN